MCRNDKETFGIGLMLELVGLRVTLTFRETTTGTALLGEPAYYATHRTRKSVTAEREMPVENQNQRNVRTLPALASKGQPHTHSRIIPRLTFSLRRLR
jgi:hypothetical protein